MTFIQQVVKIALIRLLGDTIESLKELESALLQKSEEF